MAQDDDAHGRAPGKRGARGPMGRRTGGGSAKARRSAARLAAVQALYQIELTDTGVEAVVGEFIKHRFGQEIDGETYVSPDPQLFTDIVRGTSARRGDVDRMVGGALDPRLPFERMEALLRAILRAGTFELLAHGNVHPRITINEYVEVTKAFFAGREPGMVNGVLDHLARVLRADDLATPDPSRAPASDK